MIDTIYTFIVRSSKELRIRDQSYQRILQQSQSCSFCWTQLI